MPHMDRLLRALGEIAAPVINAYHDDLRVHDARTLATAQPGDVFIWAPREHGTHLIVLAREGKPNTCAAEHYAAVMATTAPARWWIIGLDATHWTVNPLTDHAETVARWARAITKDAETVSQLYL